MPSNYETLFAFDQIDYSGQPIGLVIAETYDQAYNASKSVVITYKEIQKPIWCKPLVFQIRLFLLTELMV